MTGDSTSARDASNPAPEANDYAMGFTDGERERLVRQGGYLREITAAGFRAAGLAAGMRVLDLGCGVGDVAMLAADLVGPTGSVIGLHRDAASVAWANRRIAEAGRLNIRFQACEFGDFVDAHPFDALIGRFILTYLPSPGATLRKLSQHLRRGAIVAFFEPDFTVPGRAVPEDSLFQQCGTWMIEVLRRTGMRMDMGMHLYETYKEAGFVKSQCVVSHLSGCGVGRWVAEYIADTIRSLLPKIEQYGIATSKEIQIDTLANRLEASGRATDSQWVGSPYITAWAMKP